MLADQDTKKNEKLLERIQLQQKRIKLLRQKCRRLKQKVHDFQGIIDELKKQNFVSHESAILLEECAGSPEFLSRQILKHRGEPCPRTYGEDIRKFALTLNFLSPKAYRFVRKTYNDCLPHPRTLTKWYQTVDAEPGFTTEAFKTLKIKAQNSPRPMICTLVIDEMAIRKGLYWDNSSKKFYGRINTGIMEESDSTEEASECFVMLLTSINEAWKLPVGYFLTNSLTGEQKSHLVQVCIQMVEETGINIVALTCDGPAVNFAMFQDLGCDLQKCQEKTAFAVENQKVFAFIDPCHCIKLIRNAFGDLKVIIDREGNKIEFKYIKLLLDLQEKEGLHLGTKLSKAHVEFATQKMKVRLATQLFSNSVADALEFCEYNLKLPQFQGCSPTAQFIRIFNNVFDCLNSRSLRPPGLKKAIFCKNYGDIIQMFADINIYIKKLKLETGQLIVTSRRKTGFIGILVNMSSALNLYQTIVIEKQYLEYLPLYKISQDHLELFFSAIRSRGGYNNNPNAVQFKAAYKRLLIRAEIRDHGIGNCIPLEQISILNCPSTDEPVKNINKLTDRHILIEEDDSTLYEEYLDHLELSLSEYTEQVLLYIAGFIARKLTRCLKCDECIGLLHGSKEQHLQSIIEKKSKGGLTYPSSSLIKIVKYTEKILKQNLMYKEKPEKYYIYIYKFLMEHFENDNISNSANSEHDSSHKLLLVKSVILSYLDIRYKYYGKKHAERVSKRIFLTN